MTIKQIFVIGAGTMGNGIAQTAAVSGYQVTMMDVDPAALERAKKTIDKSTAKFLEKGKISAEQREAALNLATATDMKGAGDADIVGTCAADGCGNERQRQKEQSKRGESSHIRSLSGGFFCPLRRYHGRCECALAVEDTIEPERYVSYRNALDG